MTSYYLAPKGDQMECLSCGCKKFETKNMPFFPEIKGEEVEVVAPAFVCIQCGTALMDGDQMNILRKRADEKYRQLQSSKNINKK